MISSTLQQPPSPQQPKIKKHFKNILIKLIKPTNKKNTNNFDNSIYEVGLNITQINHNYKLVARFYKIYSFTHNIPLDYVNSILIKKFPMDVRDNILASYFKNDISFKSIKEYNSSNTLKMESNIASNIASNITENPEYKIHIKKTKIQSAGIHSAFHDDAYEIILKLSKKLKNILNQYKTDKFDLNRIFNLYDDDDIEYCNRHKIFSSEIAWGMNFSLN